MIKTKKKFIVQSADSLAIQTHVASSDITEILLKVALNTIKPNQTFKAGLTVLYIDR
jgi:hypothetical protein